MNTHLGEGRQAVGGAASVGDDVEIGGVLVLVHTDHKHAERRKREDILDASQCLRKMI